MKLRLVTPNFHDCLICNKKKYENINNKIFIFNNKEYNLNSMFAYYLAGLIEGDGSISIPNIKKGEKLRYPVIKITFAEKDLPLAEKINSYLIDGNIYKEKGKYYNLVFYKMNVNILIINLINGKLRTPKIYALYKLIDWFDETKNIKIPKLGIDFTNLNNNSWLSGFLDTDGSFSAFYKLNKLNIVTELRCYMRISQKQNKNYFGFEDNNNNLKNSNIIIDHSYLYIMNTIKDYLNVSNLRIINRNRKNFKELGYEIRTNKIVSNYILINYLNKYPLFSSKFLDYTDWKIIFDMKMNKEYKWKRGTEKLVTLKLGMNNNRINFHWEHLNNFWVI